MYELKTRIVDSKMVSMVDLRCSSCLSLHILKLKSVRLAVHDSRAYLKPYNPDFFSRPPDDGGAAVEAELGALMLS